MARVLNRTAMAIKLAGDTWLLSTPVESLTIAQWEGN
jgi:hypothetical protein